MGADRLRLLLVGLSDPRFSFQVKELISLKVLFIRLYAIFKGRLRLLQLRYRVLLGFLALLEALDLGYRMVNRGKFFVLWGLDDVLLRLAY